VDDEQFLRHPKSGSSGYLLQSSTPALQPASRPQQQQGGGLEQQRQMLEQKRREVEERTLASSERGLGLLYESERVGVATAQELSRQKEQLLHTEAKLDDINSSLRSSEKHIQGIRSVFGSIRNYFSGHSSSAAPSGGVGEAAARAQQGYNINTAAPLAAGGAAPPPPAPFSSISASASRTSHISSVDDQLDENLENMASGLARLKGLAQGLNTELSDHNDILDRVNDKTDVVGFKVDRQNKDMSKILKK